MITYATGTLGISKVIIAEFCDVSRSAITQSSRKRVSVEDDFINRLYRILKSTSTAVASHASHAQNTSLTILGKLRDMLNKRSTSTLTKVGRPKQLFNFSAIKKVIRAIVAEIASSYTHEVARTSFQEEVKYMPKSSGIFNDAFKHLDLDNDPEYQKIITSELYTKPRRVRSLSRVLDEE